MLDTLNIENLGERFYEIVASSEWVEFQEKFMTRKI